MAAGVAGMGDFTVRDIFARFYSGYLDKYTPSFAQAKTANHILNCKTGAYGSNISKCGNCGQVKYHHNSCRDRNCPMCQGFLKDKWVDAQKDYLLDAPYYHVVFTLPHELNAVVLNNQKELYSLLFTAAADTLSELSCDRKYLGARPGFISVLHTWGSDMSYHPHLHIIVLGGGLTADGSWYAKDDGFFLPVKAVSRLFKGKFMGGLKELCKNGLLAFHGTAGKYRNRYVFRELVNLCYKKEWVPYCKKAFQNAMAVIGYLGRYTHRIAMGNSRIISIDGENVTFRVKDYRNDGRPATRTIPGIEFIRRFLLHVPPKGFVRIRHYGLLSSRCKKEKIVLCRNLIGCRKYISTLKGLNGAGIIKILFGRDVHKCPSCGDSLIEMTQAVPVLVGNT